MASVDLIKFLDKYIGFLTCIILSINKLFPKRSIETKNILLIQLWGLGESILTLPTIKTLREKYPKSKIDILVTDRNKDVYFNNKEVSFDDEDKVVNKVHQLYKDIPIKIDVKNQARVHLWYEKHWNKYH